MPAVHATRPGASRKRGHREGEQLRHGGKSGEGKEASTCGVCSNARLLLLLLLLPRLSPPHLMGGHALHTGDRKHKDEGRKHRANPMLGALHFRPASQSNLGPSSPENKQPHTKPRLPASQSSQ